MKDIFITGTFRNDWNREYNLKLAEILETRGISVFLPQRDSEQLGNRKATFVQDVEGIESTKMIVAIGSKTQTANWGFEVGYAYKSKKPVVIVSDEEHPIELMPEGAASRVRIYKSLDSIEDYIDELVRDIQEFLLLA